MTCAQSNEAKIENRSFVTFSRTSGAFARTANDLAGRNHNRDKPVFLPGAHAPPVLVFVRFFSRSCAWAQPPFRCFGFWPTAAFTPESGSAGFLAFPAPQDGISSGESKPWACAYSRYQAAVTGWPKLLIFLVWLVLRRD